MPPARTMDDNASSTAHAGVVAAAMPADGRLRQPSLALLAGLGLLSMISPFATDMYLPAFPELGRDLGISVATVQLTLTVFLLGLAFGQLLWGPVSDRFGRRRPLMLGAALCVMASAVAATAPSGGVLLGARFIQGLTGAAGVVIARAIVSDLYRGAAAARVYSLLGVIIGIAPVAAPLFGGLLAAPLGWRGLLWVLTALTAAMLAAAVVIPETFGREVRRRRADPSSDPEVQPAVTRWRVLRNPEYVGHALVVTSTFMALMAYISSSPYVFQELMGLDELGSGLLFALNSLAMIGASTVNARLLAGHHRPRALLRVGLLLLTAGVLGLALVVLTGAPAWVIGGPLLVLVGSMGLIFGNALALALAGVRSVAGTGAAVIGFSQFIGGAAVAPVAGLRPDSVVATLVLLTAGACVASWAAYVVGRKK